MGWRCTLGQGRLEIGCGLRSKGGIEVRDGLRIGVALGSGWPWGRG